MKNKIISIGTLILIMGSIGFVLASNKAKIDRAAKPVIEELIVPVKVHDVKMDSFDISFSVTGTTSPAREVQIASEVQGKLVTLNISNGDFVRAGQVIATLDPSVYRVQLNSINTSIAKAELDIKRYAKLIEMGGASPIQLENAVLQHQSLLAQRKEVVTQMEHMQIRAPFSGRIENVSVEKGSFVTFGTVIGELLDNSSLKVEVSLSEQQAFRLTTGQKVTVASAVLAQPKTGKITMISDKANASGKFAAELSFDNTGEYRLKAGMLTDIHFRLQSLQTGLSIPVGALVGSTNQARVFVVKGSKVELKNIKTGIVTPDRVQVLAGLSLGDQVVISGQVSLEAGSSISITK